jgi:hypothetical protein
MPNGGVKAADLRQTPHMIVMATWSSGLRARVPNLGDR